MTIINMISEWDGWFQKKPVGISAPHTSVYHLDDHNDHHYEDLYHDIISSINFSDWDGWFWKQTVGLSAAHTSDDHTPTYLHHPFWSFHKVWSVYFLCVLCMWLLVVCPVFCCTFRIWAPWDSHKNPNWCTIKAKFIAHFPKLTWYVQILTPLCTCTDDVHQHTNMQCSCLVKIPAGKKNAILLLPKVVL